MYNSSDISTNTCHDLASLPKQIYFFKYLLLRFDSEILPLGNNYGKYIKMAVFKHKCMSSLRYSN